MERIEKTVFLSYRRTNIPWALAIFKELEHHGYDVFFDYNRIASGDFEQVIVGNITARAHFLVLLTPSALERCKDADDWLRREIETALDTKRNIVPVMLEGFDFNTPAIADQLTGKLAALRHYNGLTIPPEYFDEAMERLRDRFLNVPLSAVLHTPSVSAQEAATQQKLSARAVAAIPQEELTAQQWFERGFAATDLDEQVRFYTEAIRLKADYPEAFYNRALAHYNKGDFNGALKDYDEAIRIKPDYTNSFYGRALVLYNRRDFDGALKDYDEAIRLKPDYPEVLYNRALARAEKGDLDGALKDYDEALRLRPDHSDSFYGRALVRYNKRDLDGALKDYDDAIRLKPDYPEAFYNRALALGEKGDLDRALRDYDEAIRLKPDYADAFYNRAIIRYKKGALEGALRDYDGAIRLKPNFASAFYGRSLVRRAASDIKGAEQDLKEATRLGYKAV